MAIARTRRTTAAPLPGIFTPLATNEGSCTLSTWCLGFRRDAYVKEYEKVMKQWLEGTLRETERRHMKHWLERCSHLTMLCESVLGRMKAKHIETEEPQARATTEQDDALVLDILAEMEVQTSYSAVFYCSKERRRLVFG